jgi:hypothetical protein
VDQFPEFPPIGTSDYLDIEFFQRNQIMKGLKRCHPNNRDIIIISDVDEIIRSNKIDRIVKFIDKKIMILSIATLSFIDFSSIENCPKIGL